MSPPVDLSAAFYHKRRTEASGDPLGEATLESGQLGVVGAEQLASDGTVLRSLIRRVNEEV